MKIAFIQMVHSVNSPFGWELIRNVCEMILTTIDKRIRCFRKYSCFTLVLFLVTLILPCVIPFAKSLPYLKLAFIIFSSFYSCITRLI